jgi:rubrerythrin
MTSSIAGEIILIFSVMFTTITIAAFCFTFSVSKQKHKKELMEKKMEIIDKHFNDMIRIECPYCKTIYTAKTNECPNCKANTKKILFPEIPTKE